MRPRRPLGRVRQRSLARIVGVGSRFEQTEQRRGVHGVELGGSVRKHVLGRALIRVGGRHQEPWTDGRTDGRTSSGEDAGMRDANVFERRGDARICGAPVLPPRQPRRGAGRRASAGRDAVRDRAWWAHLAGAHPPRQRGASGRSRRPQLLTPDNARALEPGAVVAFRAGPEGAHAVGNTDDAIEPARVLIVSTMRYPDVAEHVSSGTTLAITGPREGRAFPAGTEMPLFEALTRRSLPTQGRRRQLSARPAAQRSLLAAEPDCTSAPCRALQHSLSIGFECSWQR